MQARGSVRACPDMGLVVPFSDTLWPENPARRPATSSALNAIPDLAKPQFLDLRKQELPIQRIAAHGQHRLNVSYVFRRALVSQIQQLAEDDVLWWREPDRLSMMVSDLPAQFQCALDQTPTTREENVCLQPVSMWISLKSP